LAAINLLVFGQDIRTSDFYNRIGTYDISELWLVEKFDIENDTISVERLAPLGYIGDNFQRLHIHFISAIQNHHNALEYFIYGKSKVKENICSFQGTIIIEESRTYDEGDVPNLKQGFVKGRYTFYENPHQNGAGVLAGNFKTDFYINENNEIKYDAIAFVADGFKNNQFEGTWTSYQNRESKTCNWGDYRIPDSDELDIGAGEFSPLEKYTSFGWENYIKAWGSYPDKPDVIKAREREKRKWWLD